MGNPVVYGTDLFFNLYTGKLMMILLFKPVCRLIFQYLEQGYLQGLSHQ